MHTIAFRINKELHTRIEQLATSKGLSVSAYIRMVVIESLNKDEETQKNGPPPKNAEQ